MFYSFSLTPFIFFIVVHLFLIPFSNANPSIEDNILIAFLKGDQETKMSEYSVKKYEAHLGILYYMKNNWHCDKIGNVFEEYERTECQKYRKYLDILYEYLYREYVGIPAVKPKFVFKERIEIDGPIFYAVNCLANISQFYFKANWSSFYKYKLKVFHFKPILLNQKRLNYGIKLENEPKLPINEMIMELAIDTANEWQTNESLDGIIRQKFDENLEKMFKRAENGAKENEPERRVNEINDDKHWIIMNTKFVKKYTWTEDALFSEFVKGLGTNFGKFFRMAKEYSNHLHRMKGIVVIGYYWFDLNDKRISFGLHKIEKMKEHLTQRHEALLGILYLMSENWHCDKEIAEEFKEECQKFLKYSEILYEYLFRLFVEGKSAYLANEFPAIKPIYAKHCPNNQVEFISVIEILNKLLNCFWRKNKNPLKKINFNEMILENEVQLNYEIKEEDKWISKNLRQEFDQKIQKMYENLKKKAKLEKEKENAANNKEMYNMDEEYNYESDEE